MVRFGASLATLVAFVFASVSCQDISPSSMPSAMPSAMPSDYSTIASLIGSNPNYAFLAKLLEVTEFASFLDSNDVSFTLFAPTDAAFETIGLTLEVVDQFIEMGQTDFFKVLVAYHMIPDEVLLSGDFVDGDEFETFLGKAPPREEGSIVLYISKEDAAQSPVFINDAQVEKADILASNGVIHSLAKPLNTPNIAGLIQANPDLSIFTMAMAEAEFLSSLNANPDLNLYWTIPVPNNKAFQEAGQAVDKFLQPEWSRHRDYLLRHHVVVSNETYHRSFVETYNITEIDPNRGENLTVQVDDDGNMTIANAQVVVPDMFAINGVLHILNQVLVPAQLATNMYEYLSARPEFTVLVNLVGRAGLAESLKQAGSPLTMFAPPNPAFEALGETALKFLIDPSNNDTLVDILLYHFVGENVYTSTLNETQTVKTLHGDDVELVFVDSQVTGHFFTANDIDVSDDNVLLSNGVIHILDGVLVPEDVVLPGISEPTPTDPPTPDLTSFATTTIATMNLGWMTTGLLLVFLF